MLLSLLLARDGPGDLGDLSRDRDLLILGGLLRLNSESWLSLFESAGCCPLFGGGLNK